MARTSHIVRIYKDDDPTNDQWIDIERIDGFTVNAGGPGHTTRELHWKFDWNSFDPKGTDEDGQKIPTKKIKDPSADKGDNSSVVEVPARRLVHVTSGSENQNQEYKHYFVNDDTNKSRETHSRRIYHHEVGAEYLDENGQPPRDPDDYLSILGDQEEGNYVDVEILDRYWTDEHASSDVHGFKRKSQPQRRTWLLDSKVDPLLQEPMVDGDTVGADFSPVNNPDAGPQVDPPWRIDPLQNIVNVNWGGLAVIFGPQSDDAPDQKKKDPKLS